MIWILLIDIFITLFLSVYSVKMFFWKKEVRNIIEHHFNYMTSLHDSMKNLTEELDKRLAP